MLIRGSLALFALLAAAAGDSPSSKFVGYWYGENYQPVWHSYTQEFDHNRSDGTFEAEFRKYENCRLVFRQVEIGTWSIANDVVHQITRAIDGRMVDAAKDPSLIDDYQILVLDDHEYQSKWMTTGETMTVWRVGEHFQFPKCEFTS